MAQAMIRYCADHVAVCERIKAIEDWRTETERREDMCVKQEAVKLRRQALRWAVAIGLIGILSSWCMVWFKT